MTQAIWSNTDVLPMKGDAGSGGPSVDPLVSEGMMLFATSKNARGLVEDRWAKSNDLYDAKFSKSESEFSKMLGIPRIFIPKTYAQVQRMMEDALETFFFDFEEICGISAWKSIPTATLNIVKALMNYRLNSHPIQFYQEAYEYIQDGIKNKIGIFKVYPKLKTKPGKVKRIVIKENGASEIVDEDGQVVDNFSPIIECLPYEDVFFSNQATWKDYFKFPMIHRTRKDVNWCKRRGFTNIDQVTTNLGDQPADAMKTQRAQDQLSPFSAPNATPEAIKDLWVYEIWSFRENKDGELEGGSYVMGGSTDQMPTVLFRGWEKNDLPYNFDPFEPVRPPIICGFAFPESHVMYGKDFPQITEGLQKETNAQRNQEREAVARALRAPILVNKNAGLDLMSLMYRKIGGLVLGNDIGPEAARELIGQNPLALTQGSQQRTDLDYGEISSITPAQLGQQRNPSESATAFAGVDRNANKKINMMIRNLAVTGIIPAFNYLCRLEQAYESDYFIELVTGRKLGWHFKKDEKGQHVGPSPRTVIQGDFDFTCNIGTNKQAQIQQNQRMLELGNQANLALGQLVQFHVADPNKVKFIDPMFFVKEIARLSGQKNTDEIEIQAVPPPPPPPQTPPAGGGGESGGKATPPAISSGGAPSGEAVLGR